MTQTIDVPLRRRLTLVITPAALTIYFLVLAISDFVAGAPTAGTVSLVLCSLSSFLAFRIAGVRLVIRPDSLVGEGVFSGWSVRRSDISDIVVERRVFGWNGLGVVTSSGSSRKVPLLLAAVPDKELDPLQREIRAAVFGSGSGSEPSW